LRYAFPELCSQQKLKLNEKKSSKHKKNNKRENEDILHTTYPFHELWGPETAKVSIFPLRAGKTQRDMAGVF